MVFENSPGPNESIRITNHNTPLNKNLALLRGKSLVSEDSIAFNKKF